MPRAFTKQFIALLLLSIFCHCAVALSTKEVMLKRAKDLISRKDYKAAIKILAPLSEDKTFVLSDYAQYYIAGISLDVKDYVLAQRALRNMISNNPDSFIIGNAFLKLAEINEKQKNHFAAANIYLEAANNDNVLLAKDELILLAAKEFEKAGNKKEAVSTYLEMLRLYPASSYFYEVRDRLTLLDAEVPPQDANALYLRAGADFAAREYGKAAKNYYSFVSRYPSDERAKQAYIRLGMSYYRSQDFDKAISVFKNASDTPEAKYYLAFAAWRKGEDVAAFEGFKKLFSDYPNNNLTYSAKYEIAKYYASNGYINEARDVYENLINEHPETDAAAKAGFDRGFEEYKKGDFESALSYFTKPRPDDAANKTKLEFWAAKTQNKLGQEEEYSQMLATLSESVPQTYYSFRAAQILGVNENSVSGPLNDEQMISKISCDESWFVKFKALYNAGLYQEALDASQKADSSAARTCEALVMKKLAKYRKAISIVERNIEPEDMDETAKTISYPKGFEVQVKQYAKKYGLDPYLMFALIREESRFDSGALSRVRAHGLTQIMPRTGKGIAKKLKLPYSEGNMLKPSQNIKMGSYYLSQMIQMFNGNVFLGLASYNGGAGNVSKWLKNISYSDMDEFIESIPFTETRNYVKKVMASYGKYKTIYEGTGDR